jgi:hypothetical protein
VPDRIQAAFAKIAPTPEFQAALKNPRRPRATTRPTPNFIHSLQQAQTGGGGGDAVNPLSDSSFIQQLDRDWPSRSWSGSPKRWTWCS